MGVISWLARYADNDDDDVWSLWLVVDLLLLIWVILVYFFTQARINIGADFTNDFEIK